MAPLRQQDLGKRIEQAPGQRQPLAPAPIGGAATGGGRARGRQGQQRVEVMQQGRGMTLGHGWRGGRAKIKEQADESVLADSDSGLSQRAQRAADGQWQMGSDLGWDPARSPDARMGSTAAAVQCSLPPRVLPPAAGPPMPLIWPGTCSAAW